MPTAYRIIIKMLREEFSKWNPDNIPDVWPPQGNHIETHFDGEEIVIATKNGPMKKRIVTPEYGGQEGDI